MKGKVKFVNKQNGWGFITGPDGKDIFFHVTDFEVQADSVKIYDGCPVEYEIGQSRKGPKAIKIIKLEENE